MRLQVLHGWRVGARMPWERLRRALSTARPDPSHVDTRHAPQDFGLASAVVYSAFITETEGDSLVQDIESRMKRRRYEKGHWDAVITDYKEVELLDQENLRIESQNVIRRVRQQLVEAGHVERNVVWLPCHAIDLKRNGELKAHVDSVKFSGDLVAGISLLSSSIMRLKPDKDDEQGDNASGFVDLYLPPLSLYVLTSVSRYQYLHELLPSGAFFEILDKHKIPVQRDRRLSVIFRDAKRDDS